MTTLSLQAQEILNLMELVRVHPETKNHIYTDKHTNRKWLSISNNQITIKKYQLSIWS